MSDSLSCTVKSPKSNGCKLVCNLADMNTHSLHEYTSKNDAYKTPTIAPFESSIGEISDIGEIEEWTLPIMTPMNVTRKNNSNDIYTAARHFSNLSDPTIIRRICQKEIPGWDVLDSEDILVDQLMFGLSNQLFKISINESHALYNSIDPNKVLFRVYGKDVDVLYDLETEIRTFKTLSTQNIAPKMISSFEGGRIEEWIEGSTLLVDDMGKPSVISGAALIIAGLHTAEIDITYGTTRLDFFLDRWRKRAMDIYHSTKPGDPNYLSLQRLYLPLFYEESFKLKEYLFPRNCKVTEVTKLKFCHNDIQENNIMLTPESMRMVDFEYSGLNYPAYDIASYFWEMTCDYCVDTYPFFCIQPTKYPSIEKRRLFCAIYLKKILKKPIQIKDRLLLDPVLDAVERFQLATNMLWGFWAVIRSPQAPTASQFDMLYYAQKRIDAYWTQKAMLMSLKKFEVLELFSHSLFSHL